MSVTLTPKLEDFIREKVDSGQYPNADAVVLEALRLLDERDRRQRLLNALEEGRKGEGIPFTPQLMEEIRREAKRMIKEDIQPDPDVCP
jgi:antitoxin ParD1/3/4